VRGAVVRMFLALRAGYRNCLQPVSSSCCLLSFDSLETAYENRSTPACSVLRQVNRAVPATSK
jgi:hypothetical protein